MIPLNAILEFGESTSSTSMGVSDLLGEDVDVEEVETSEELNAPEVGSVEDSSEDDEPVQVQTKNKPKANTRVSKERDDDEYDDDESLEDGEDEKKEAAEQAKSIADIQTITHLAKFLRNEGLKFTVFNIKETLINYLEMFGERKVARHILDQDAHAFYEIHAAYVPGAVMYRNLVKLGFKPIHPTDLNENYHKDMSYDVAMSNGKLFINIFGGLQQHAHAEETVIRNLYARERMRYAAPLGISTSSVVELTEEKVSKHLLLAAMQSHSLGREDLSKNFFQEAMNSSGIDSLILSMSENDEVEEPSVLFPEYDGVEHVLNDAETKESELEIEATGAKSSFEQAVKYVEPTDVIKVTEDTVTDEERVNALSPEGIDIFKVS